MSRRLLVGGGAVAALPLAFVLVLTLAFFGSGADADDGLAPMSACLPLADAAPVAQLDPEQAANARAIVAAGRAAKVPGRGLVVAIATAQQESTLRNVDHGDAAGTDSRGLFQQRRPWGSEADRMTPGVAARLFFTGGEDVDGAGPDGEEPGLLDIPGWERMPLAAAAQKVQRSQFPDAYARWETLALSVVTAILGESPQGLCDDAGDPGAPDVASCPAYRYPGVEVGLQPNALAVLRCGARAFPRLRSWGCLAQSGHVSNSDHYTGRACDAMVPGWQSPDGVALGDEVASYYRRHAKAFGVTYIIWRARIWNATRDGEGWRPYRHPSGVSTPTLLHMDHVHISVS